jgi:hypothetical protein
MDWLIRFSLGLKARRADLKALHKALPELHEGNLQIEHRHYFWLFEPDFGANEELLEALRQWSSEAEIFEGYPPNNNVECPLKNCPLQNKTSEEVKNDEPFITQLMVATGGPNSKPPRASFFNLISRTHPQNDPPREVILTDPYIYSDISEEGKEGGFLNLVKYLETLGLNSDDSFTLRMNPAPKRGTLTAKRNLQRHLRNKFKNILFKDYSSQLKFHDRFYVVRHRSGLIKGVFGPSMNGLNSDSIVLMGDIEGIQPQKKLENWFG